MGMVFVCMCVCVREITCAYEHQKPSLKERLTLRDRMCVARMIQT